MYLSIFISFRCWINICTCKVILRWFVVYRNSFTLKRQLRQQMRRLRQQHWQTVKLTVISHQGTRDSQKMIQLQFWVEVNDQARSKCWCVWLLLNWVRQWCYAYSESWTCVVIIGDNCYLFARIVTMAELNVHHLSVPSTVWDLMTVLSFACALVCGMLHLSR